MEHFNFISSEIIKYNKRWKILMKKYSFKYVDFKNKGEKQRMIIKVGESLLVLDTNKFQFSSAILKLGIKKRKLDKYK